MVRDAVHYLRALPKRPWLVLGKGPSLDWLPELDDLIGDGYGFDRPFRELVKPSEGSPAIYTLTLNHACLRKTPDLALFMDLDAYLDCRYRLPVLRDVGCLPWRPHIDNVATVATLGSLGKSGMVDDNLLAFNSSTAGSKLPRHPHLSRVPVRFFSAVAAFNLLGLAGVDQIYTLGVDGGTGYAQGFDQKDLLSNGRKSFDVQFGQLKKARIEYVMDWVKLSKAKT